MSTKITGEECIGGHFFGSDQTAFSTSEKGIPIRLWIATQIYTHWVDHGGSELVLQETDRLITAYNNTPNPNV